MSVQRNDPCPCGSGRKYKRCCQRGNAPKSNAPETRPIGTDVIVPTKAPVEVIAAARKRALTLSVDRIEDLHSRLRRTLEEFDRDHGLKSSISAVSYTHESGHMTLETSIIREDGVVMDRQAIAFLHRAQEHGLSSEWLGRSFVCGNDRVRIVGLKPRSRESVILESVPEPGKPPQRFKMHPSQLAAHFE